METELVQSAKGENWSDVSQRHSFEPPYFVFGSFFGTVTENNDRLRLNSYDKWWRWNSLDGYLHPAGDPSRVFSYAFPGKPLRKYKIRVLWLREDVKGDYVVAREMYERRELQELARYCACTMCTGTLSWLLWWIRAPTTYGCLHIADDDELWKELGEEFDDPAILVDPLWVATARTIKNALT